VPSSFATRARAQADVQADAAEAGYADVIREAVEHYEARRWHDAHAAFARAHALRPSARTHRGLGLAAFYLGDFPAARRSFEQALADARRPLPEAQRGELARLLAETAAATGRFELRTVPASARAEVDGTAVEHGALVLARGEHVLAISAAGHAPHRSFLTVHGGEDRALEIVLTAQPSATAELARNSAPSANETAAAAPSAARTRTRPSADAPVAAAEQGDRLFTWIAASAVPAFAGAAAAAWFTGQAKRDQIERNCARDRCDRAEAERRVEDAGLGAHEDWTHVSLAAAGVALISASVLFIVEGRAGGRDAPGIELGGAGSGATLRGRF
jgi:hypothetical protein